MEIILCLCLNIQPFPRASSSVSLHQNSEHLLIRKRAVVFPALRLSDSVILETFTLGKYGRLLPTRRGK